MPSPLGHALGGIAAGWTARPGRASRSVAGTLRSGALFAALGAGARRRPARSSPHQGPTHSLGAALVAGLAVGRAHAPARRLGARRRAAPTPRHVLLDWLGADTRAAVRHHGALAVQPRTTTMSRLRRLRSASRGATGCRILDAQPEAVARELLILGAARAGSSIPAARKTPAERRPASAADQTVRLASGTR